MDGNLSLGLICHPQLRWKELIGRPPCVCILTKSNKEVPPLYKNILRKKFLTSLRLFLSLSHTFVDIILWICVLFWWNTYSSAYFYKMQLLHRRLPAGQFERIACNWQWIWIWVSTEDRISRSQWWSVHYVLCNIYRNYKVNLSVLHPKLARIHMMYKIWTFFRMWQPYHIYVKVCTLHHSHHCKRLHPRCFA